MFCLITDLLDHAACPAGQLAAAYAWRWAGSETALKEAKSAITGAGPSAGPIFRSDTRADRRRHAACDCGTELVRALARAAARHAAPPAKAAGPGSRSSPARSLLPPPPRRPGQYPVRCRHREPARRHDRDLPPRHPACPRQTPDRHRPPPAPRPENQNPPGIPQRSMPSPPAPRSHESASQARRGLTATTPILPETADVEPAAAGATVGSAHAVTLRNQDPDDHAPPGTTSRTPDHAEVHGIEPVVRPQQQVACKPPDGHMRMADAGEWLF